MNLLWQNKFEGFDLARTSPLYYRCSVERDNRILNCYYFDKGLGITETSFSLQNGQILLGVQTAIQKNTKKNIRKNTKNTILNLMILYLGNIQSLIMGNGDICVRKMRSCCGKNP